MNIIFLIQSLIIRNSTSFIIIITNGDQSFETIDRAARKNAKTEERQTGIQNGRIQNEGKMEDTYGRYMTQQVKKESILIFFETISMSEMVR